MRTIAIAAGLLAACTTAALAEGPSYPMLCRGGPGMRIMVSHDVDGAGMPGATAMHVYFNRAPAAANTMMPPPGTCAWKDRPLAGNEPAVLWIKAPNVTFAFQVMANGVLVRDGSGPRLSVEGASMSPDAGKWERIVRGVLTGGTFEVMTYNSGGSVMVITDVL